MDEMVNGKHQETHALDHEQALYPLDAPLHDDEVKRREDSPSEDEHWHDDDASGEIRVYKPCCTPTGRRKKVLLAVCFLLVILVVGIILLVFFAGKIKKPKKPNTHDPADWMKKTDEDLRMWKNKMAQARWAHATDLTPDNGRKLSKISENFEKWEMKSLLEAKEILSTENGSMSADLRRELKEFQNTMIPMAKNESTRKKIQSLMLDLDDKFVETEVLRGDDKYQLNPNLTSLFTESRDWNELLWAWQAWHDAAGKELRKNFSDLVEALNEAARDNGFEDVGVPWRLANFEEDKKLVDIVDKLYVEIKPLYEQLHTYVRSKLIQAYPDHGIEEDGPIPAHILGNMYAQQWSGILDILTPYPESPSYDVTAAMVQQNYTVRKMYELADEFFVSLGMEPMTNDFWQNSMIVRPPGDITVNCHGSAHDMYATSCEDFRIKKCTEVTMEDLYTVHHEMGHVQYFMQYCHLPVVFRTSACAAFHEAVGDVISLSVSAPSHLRAIHLLEEAATENEAEEKKRNINFLMKLALEKIAFLPFAYATDKWRWDVFSGDIPASEMNKKWWEYRIQYQGIRAPVDRDESCLDPAAKYHVAANVPYIRYFLSFIVQFQFHEALCKSAGHTGPLHACDIYRSKAAGDRLKSMLALGRSQPWPVAMEALTGQRDFSVDAIQSYFQPLVDWLIEANKDKTVGWNI